MADEIIIRGAREHNLKNIDVNIPRNKLICVTGVSGSGKSTLVFDTIFAEANRRYVSSLSAYARQFLGTLPRPDIESIEGLSPAISIEQKTVNRSPRSTVATTTEIYDYLRLMFARVGKPHCPNCGKLIGAQSLEQILSQAMLLEIGKKFMVCAPVVRDRKGEYVHLLEQLRQDGFTRILLNGEMRSLDDDIVLEKKDRHDISVVVDRLVMRADLRPRLADSVETALKVAEGLVDIVVLDTDSDGNIIYNKPVTYSERFACSECGTSIPEMEPRAFSFNSPVGACNTCSGLGAVKEVDPELLVVDENLTIKTGTLAPKGIQWKGGYWDSLVLAIADKYKIPTNKPWKSLTIHQKEILMYGPPGGSSFSMSWRRIRGGRRTGRVEFHGLVNYLNNRYQNTSSESLKGHIENLMREHPCPTCKGARLRKEMLGVTIKSEIVNDKGVKEIIEKNISDVTALDIKQAKIYIENLILTPSEEEILKTVRKEICARLDFLHAVSLDHISLNRTSRTLSGGEQQRISLSSQIATALTGVIFCLDEPSASLDPAAAEALLIVLEELVKNDNTVILTEHDPVFMGGVQYETGAKREGALIPHLIEIGPLAGVQGGNLIAQGTPKQLMKQKNSLTGQYLAGKRVIPIPERKKPDGRKLVVHGARENNLKNITAEFDVGLFNVVTGVSGSGKSTLVNDILSKALAQKFNKSKDKPGEYDKITGMEHFDQVRVITQDPIGRSSRSNPLTYVGAWDEIRKIYSMVPLARQRGYKPGRFSFNVPAGGAGGNAGAGSNGGRCEYCKGLGTISVEMVFMEDAEIICEVCEGKRFNSETLEILYKGKSISDVLDMNLEEALEFFKAIPALKRKLQALCDLKLNYLNCGASSVILSGGESSRVKISKEMAKSRKDKMCFLIDEPTGGMSWSDIESLLNIFLRLREEGHTLIVISHALEVIKMADQVTLLGWGAGHKLGGNIVAKGTPEEIIKVDKKTIGKYLAPMLGVEK